MKFLRYTGLLIIYIFFMRFVFGYGYNDFSMVPTAPFHRTMVAMLWFGGTFAYVMGIVIDGDILDN